MLGTSTDPMNIATREGNDNKEQNKQKAKAMTFHFELDNVARGRGSRRSSTTSTNSAATVPLDHQALIPSNTFKHSHEIMSDGQYSASTPTNDDNSIEMPQRKQQQRRASAKYYVKNKEAIKEKRRMRYWVGILTKIAERNNPGSDRNVPEGEDERGSQWGNGLKEAVFVMESGQPRQRQQMAGKDHDDQPQNQQREDQKYAINQEYPAMSINNSSAVQFHEQLNAVICDGRMERRDDLVLGLKPILEAMLTRMIELEQQQQQQQTF